MRASFRFLRRALPGGLALLLGCTDPYLPDVIKAAPNYLVVDGFLNSQGVTSIRLSRTAAISATATPPVEAKATVYIEDEANTRVLLRETLSGTYTSPAQVLSPARKYRLHINTLGGKEYTSDFVPVKTTPPIDAVTWRADNTGLNILVNAHDATSATQYYRWETDETWEITPIYRPLVEYVGGMMRNIVVRYPTICWGNAHSTIIQIDKTTALSQDVVADFRVRQLPASSERLNSRYSILVQQHALTREEYAYWELLRKNTESIGTLFDPQPVQVTGNVHSVGNATEIVLGYVGAHSLTEKRIFISRPELPRTWPVLNGYEGCLPPDTVYIDRPAPVQNPAVTLQSNFSGGSFLPIETLYSKTGGITGYTAKTRDCVDCRTRGAAVRPSFW